jgi:hypothetical protein
MDVGGTQRVKHIIGDPSSSVTRLLATFSDLTLTTRLTCDKSRGHRRAAAPGLAVGWQDGMSRHAGSCTRIRSSGSATRSLVTGGPSHYCPTARLNAALNLTCQRMF